MRMFTACLLTTAALPVAGCGEVPSQSSVASRSFVAPASAPAPDAAPSGGMMGETGREEASSAAAPAGVSRKVIYDATLDLAVDELDRASAKVGELVASSGGYIAEETMTGSPGSTRSQFWRLRIPVDGFDGFVKSVMALGELVQFSRKSQDVTAEYYDVEARIKNKQIQEQTLNKILQERSGQLEEVLKVEVELSRVRGEIEQMQGRLRVLQNLSSLATLTLTLRERDRFQPPAPVVADFSTQVARTWYGSVERMTDAVKGLILFAVSVAVWLPLWLVGLGVALIGLRVVNRLRPFFKAQQVPSAER
ncbi:DUF4349 domain-containing protein [Paludisphaera rhizosphaerae]|uniref:DUF4349 domain-containing protein n=1 Tax=Paludisphaera rhizosphaerae TaxID=2711216 RepID=UPI0013EAF6A0|nr:DUF4349 domain-containing protein [Paludisphaera rhizosphaerae]